ncbi:ABC transporter substrate-binding protein [Sedimentibacter sp.]|uniref:ABC transporter substrate-binding protein n=1 Tax=Sedimentibacter sp. TaxID=1960295 RepID=UPI0028A09187|nr:ABC transporter substrate-binding protein [Sedimentibacter sp.]
MNKITKKISLSIAIILIFASLVACTSNGQPAEPADQGANQEQPQVEAPQLPTTDRAGNEVNIPEEINRIISISPSNTEIIIALGSGDKLVAVDKHSSDIEGIPADIPQFDIMNPDVEQLVALSPDIIYATGMSMAKGNDPFKPIKDLGITVVYIPSSSSIEGIYEDILYISETLQVRNKAVDIVNDMIEKIDEYREFGSKIENKKTVYFEIAGAPNLYSFGSGVFLNEMIEILGAENILKDQEQWIAVSEEAIVSKNPDVILTNVDYIANATDEIKIRSGWENITAVKNNDVYYIDKDASSLSNHNIIKALDQMAKAIYPDAYKK